MKDIATSLAPLPTSRRGNKATSINDVQKLQPPPPITTEETILQQLERQTEVTTQTLRDEMSTQNAVLQAYQKDRVTARERKAEGHAKITELLANLARKKAEYETRLRVLDKDFDASVTERKS